MDQFIKEAFAKFDFSNIQNHIVWITIIVGALFFAMFVDLISGIHKARKAGIARTSVGYKRTCTKAEKYLMPLMCTICIDLLISVISPLPIFSLLLGSYNVFCELKSVTEKYYKKAELRKAEKTMNIVLENKADVAKMLVELYRAEEERQNGKNNKDNRE